MNRISDILADFAQSKRLAQPRPVFLGIFLKELDLSNLAADADSAAIREHYTSSGRRIDLLLTFRGGKAIGIENKTSPPTSRTR
jgi:hypothetical protein